MLIPSRRYQESAASLAQSVALAEEVGAAAGGDHAEVPHAPAPDTSRRRWIWPYVAVLLVAVGAVAAISPTHAIAHRPWLLVLLVATTVAADLVRIDVFDRINISPAWGPALALAFLFGPLGPIAAELVIATIRLLRRVEAVRWAFDVGALGLAGAAAAGVWSAGAPSGTAEELGIGAAAALATYLVTSLLLPFVIHLARGQRAVAAWREQLAWLWPHYLGFGLLAAGLVEVQRQVGDAGILLVAVPLVLLWVGEQQYLRRSRAGVIALRDRNEQLEAANGRIRHLLEHAHVSYLQAITTLGHALQAREPDGAGRTERVSQLSRILGESLGMKGPDLDALTVGVVLHDIGRVCLRPREDPAVVPELSAAVLEPLDLPPIVKDMARHHGERFDGRGRPDRLSGSAIPLPARIVSVADALDDLTSSHSLQDAAPLPRAIELLRAESGTRFCPGVVAALERCLAADPSLRRYFGDRPGG